MHETIGYDYKKETHARKTVNEYDYLEFEGKNYGEFKRVVADKVCEVIGNIQNKYNEILNGDLIDRVLDDGRDFTREIACKKYEELKNKIGLVR
mgnify:CR=1 FL=1